MSRESYGLEELESVRALQRLAYDCAEEVASGLEPGVTEREAAARLGARCRERGVHGFFHIPFAWFGDRAGFYRFPTPAWRRPLSHALFARPFFPTDRRLEEGMCAILDVAPIKDGLAADIGYSFALGENIELQKALVHLLELRELILARVRAGATMRQLYRDVAAALEAAGYESAHALYPSRVLAHKIGRLPRAGWPARIVNGFDVRSLLYFGRQIATALPGVGRLPLWNEGPLTDVRPDPGLWAFEPHIRANGIGAKWEEILVVTESDAYWLDDDLPHLRRSKRSATPASAS